MASSGAPQRRRCAKCGTIGDGVFCGHGIGTSTCRAVTYCSAACKHAHAAVHNTTCLKTALSSPDRLVRESRPFASNFSPVGDYDRHFGADLHPTMCPCTALMGIPLVLVVVDTTLQATLQPSGTLLTDLLMMDPDTGYLVQSLPWRVGDYQNRMLGIHREDGKPLTQETLETVLEFLLVVLEEMSTTSPLDGWLPLREYLTPPAFQMFARRYFGEQRARGREGFDGPFAPL